MAEDYYSILGVSKTVGQEELKSAYKKLVKQHHPDLNKGKNDEKFKKINEAYETLKDSGKRKQYDAFGSNYEQQQQYGGQGQGGQRYYQYSGSGDQDFNFDEILRHFSGGFNSDFGFGSSTGRRKRSEKGQSLQYSFEINLEDSFHGTTKNIEIPSQEVCDSCDGTGAEKGHIKTCTRCGGSGQVKRVVNSFFGSMVSVSVCSACGGQGQTADKKCEHCHGKGVVKSTKKLDVKIPKGIVSGTVLRLSGQGFGAKGGKGDLFIQIQIKPHPIFDVQENNLYCKTTIDFATAVLGGEIEIPTIDGKAKLKIPSGTQSNTIFRMRGSGMPNMSSHSSRGDQLVKVVVKIPETLTKEQKDAISQSFNKQKTAETKKGFFEKVKDFFE